MSERIWSETAVDLEEGVGLSTDRRSLSRLFVSPMYGLLQRAGFQVTHVQACLSFFFSSFQREGTGENNASPRWDQLWGGRPLGGRV